MQEIIDTMRHCEVGAWADDQMRGFAIMAKREYDALTKAVADALVHDLSQESEQ